MHPPVDHATREHRRPSAPHPPTPGPVSGTRRPLSDAPAGGPRHSRAPQTLAGGFAHPGPVGGTRRPLSDAPARGPPHPRASAAGARLRTPAVAHPLEQPTGRTPHPSRAPHAPTPPRPAVAHPLEQPTGRTPHPSRAPHAPTPPRPAVAHPLEQPTGRTPHPSRAPNAPTPPRPAVAHPLEQPTGRTPHPSRAQRPHPTSTRRGSPPGATDRAHTTPRPSPHGRRPVPGALTADAGRCRCRGRRRRALLLSLTLSTGSRTRHCPSTAAADHLVRSGSEHERGPHGELAVDLPDLRPRALGGASDPDAVRRGRARAAPAPAAAGQESARVCRRTGVVAQPPGAAGGNGGTDAAGGRGGRPAAHGFPACSHPPQRGWTLTRRGPGSRRSGGSA